jgi:2-polyprenyl-3-methyl-5-hydroxy-6-metoxy-1,4-benzoquinol methylase
VEWKLFQGDQPPEQSTFEFHEHRERARHLEQSPHSGRLLAALDFVKYAVDRKDCKTVVDLGCGDGGLLSLIRRDLPDVKAWGYEFTPANLAGATERGVNVSSLDFVNNLEQVRWGDITVMTEVLEHLHRPHEVLEHVADNTKILIASSPWVENDLSHDACHVWAWDMDGYTEMVKNAGFRIISHVKVSLFQVIMCRGMGVGL